MKWVGWDGSEWDLTGRTGPVKLLSGATGQSMPPIQRHTTESPALHGSTWRGWRGLERPVAWPLLAWRSASASDWTRRDRAFWSTLRPDRVGWWVVTQLDAEGAEIPSTARRLPCRFESDGPWAPDMLPQVSGWAMYDLRLIAEAPFWESVTPRKWTFRTATVSNFYGGGVGTMATPFVISPGSVLDTASVDNMGDVDCYPIYRITATGAGTDLVQVGYAGNRVVIDTHLAAGQQRIVDTAPDKLTVVDAAGVDRWDDLGDQADFDAPIPPGRAVRLDLAIDGEGEVEVELRDRWFRAW